MNQTQIFTELGDEEFHSKYANCNVTFANFLGVPKPVFCFSGMLDNGNILIVSVGGSADALSLLHFGTQPIKVSDICPFAAVVYKGSTIVERWSE